jgi:hypothetical protein
MNVTLPRALAAVALALFCSAPAASAQDSGGDPANWCRNGLFAGDANGFRLGRVKGARGARAYFHGDEDGCPGPSAKCRQKAYVVAGDELIVSRAFGEYVCAWYQPARGRETVGWIDAGRLEVSDAEASPALSLWLGAWEFYSNSVRITRGAKAGALRVEGEAFWHGVNPGNVHTGELGGEAAPAGNVLSLGDGEDICRATLRLVGPYLVVDDNGECGGANVTFGGVYRKKKY